MFVRILEAPELPENIADVVLDVGPKNGVMSQFEIAVSFFIFTEGSD
jgi:hypothetical protein